MAWEVEVSDEFREWYEALDAEEQDSVTYSVDLLRFGGPDSAARTWMVSKDHITAT